jgi:hypothetical protein
MMKSIAIILLILLFGCSGSTEQRSSQDSVTVDSVIASKIVTPQPVVVVAPKKVETHNFYGYQTYTLTEDENEAKVWRVLGPLLEKFDSTEFNTLSKNYTIPKTEETPEGTVSSVESVTITLYYNNDQQLVAYKKEYNYELDGPEHFDKAFTIYLFDKNIMAAYEDRETAIDMATKQYTRAAINACPNCGVYLSAGVSSSEIIVSGSIREGEFSIWESNVLQIESRIVEYAYADSFSAQGDDYVYQTVEPLNNEVDYDVYYTANKGYYEKFLKPILKQ